MTGARWKRDGGSGHGVRLARSPPRSGGAEASTPAFQAGDRGSIPRRCTRPGLAAPGPWPVGGDGRTRHPLKVEIAGSSPARVTNPMRCESHTPGCYPGEGGALPPVGATPGCLSGKGCACKAHVRRFESGSRLSALGRSTEGSCGRSSDGRARRCQRRGRGFDPRRPLQGDEVLPVTRLPSKQE